MNIKAEIGTRITQSRKAKGFTIKKLAELTKELSAARISNWEQGTRSPGPMEAKLIARILEVAPSYLLCLSDNPNGELYSSDNLPLHVPVLSLQLQFQILGQRKYRLLP